MSHRKWFGLAVLVTLVVTVSGASAGQKDRAGANAGATLRISPSAKAASMGDAYAAAAAGDIESLYYNPAGLAFSSVLDNGGERHREIGGMYQNLVLDIGQGAFAYAHPINGHSGWGALVQYVDFGTTQRTVVSGTAGANSGTFTGHDIAGSLSYGARMGDEFSYGATGKVYSSNIDDVTATAIAADLGVRWEPSNRKVALGVTVNNLGSTIKYDVETERLPTTFRVGAMWSPWVKRLRVTADVEKEARGGWSAHAGAEYTFADIVSLRVGYDGSLHVDEGLTVGGGVRLKGFDLNYAYIPFGDVGNNHRMGLSYRF